MNSVQEKMIARLKAIMQENNFNQKQLRFWLQNKGLDVSMPTINYWLNGKKIPKNNFDKLCGILEISVDDYQYKFQDVEKKKFKLLGQVACGEPIEANEEWESYVMADAEIDADFCLKCKGDSMLPLVHDGDIVFVKKQDSVRNGEVAVVIIENEATLKRVYQEDDKITLVAENRAYAPIVILASENKSIRICGKALFYQSLIK